MMSFNQENNNTVLTANSSLSRLLFKKPFIGGAGLPSAKQCKQNWNPVDPLLDTRSLKGIDYLCVGECVPAKDQSGRSVRGPYSLPLRASPCLNNKHKRVSSGGR